MTWFVAICDTNNRHAASSTIYSHNTLSRKGSLFWMDVFVDKNEGQVQGRMTVRCWIWFMGLIIQSRAVFGGVRKRNSSAFTFRAHNWIEHMFNMSWFAFMSAKDCKKREYKRKQQSLKLKIHVHSHLHIMLRTGFNYFSRVCLRLRPKMSTSFKSMSVRTLHILCSFLSSGTCGTYYLFLLHFPTFRKS